MSYGPSQLTISPIGYAMTWINWVLATTYTYVLIECNHPGKHIGINNLVEPTRYAKSIWPGCPLCILSLYFSWTQRCFQVWWMGLSVSVSPTLLIFPPQFWINCATVELSVTNGELHIQYINIHVDHIVTYLALMNICAYLPWPSGHIGTIT